MNGHVRVVPVEARIPLPPSPMHDGPEPVTFYAADVCGERVLSADVPLSHPVGLVGYRCTRAPHGDDEPHVWHYPPRRSFDDHGPHSVPSPPSHIVWGGE